MGNNINYKMITVACHARRLTQKDLAQKVPSLKQQTLSKIERGLVALTEDDIINIAVALDYPVEFFYQEEVKTPVSNIYFRKRAVMPIKDLNKLMADVKIILKGIDYLLEEIDFTEYPKYVYDISEGWTPETIAGRMREILGLDRDKPVTDIVTRIEDLGVIVFFYDCANTKFDGLTSYTDNGVPVIFVNKNLPNERIKFTIVHEFSHLVAHIPCDIEPWRDIEGEANSITSHFYLPAKYCSNDLRDLSYAKLGEIKSYWGVSKSALIRRAKDLGLISAETYTYLNIELGRRGERTLEQGYVEIDKPKVLKTIINLLRNEAGYSQEDLAKRIYLQVNDYSILFEPQTSPQVKLKSLRVA